MTGRGADIFQECRLALVRIGSPAIPALVDLFQGKNTEIAAMAKEQSFVPGVVPMKAAILLGDLRAREAVPALLGRLRGGEQGKEHGAIIIALGQIGTTSAVDALIGVAKDAKAKPMLRASASDAIYLSGDKRAVPVLLDVAKSADVMFQGHKDPSLRANAAIDLARIAGPEHFDAFKALADKETAAEGQFGEALDRMQVAKECGTKLDCYGKTLSDESVPRAEKAAFTLGFSGDKAAIPLLLGALRPIASIPQHRYAVHQAILFALTRLADKSCKECGEKLRAQIEKDEKAVRLPGVPGMLGETRVALAIIENTDPGARKLQAMAAAAPDEVPAPAGKGAAKGGKGKPPAAKAGGGKKGKRR
jgi:HEAT repeat protein